jgi:hypothetical protein
VPNTINNSIYGLEAAILPSPWSAILSILLLFGVWKLGDLILSNFNCGHVFIGRVMRYQSGLIGVMVLSIIIFPLTLLGIFNRTLAELAAIFLSILGFVSIPSIYSLLKAWLSECSLSGISWFLKFLYISMLVGYFFLALGPITEADPLDYHVGVALKILNTGAFPAESSWFHGRLAGSGESIIALGFAVGAAQFGALVQWLGLFSVVTLLLTLTDNYVDNINKSSTTLTVWAVLIVLSTPVYLAWISSPKPMVLPGAMTTLALFLSFTLFRHNLKIRTNHHVFYLFLIFGLVLCAASMKFSFYLSAGLIIWLTLFFQIKIGRLIIALLILVACLLVIYSPFIFWKYYYFGGNLIELLTSPLPGNWLGTREFVMYLRNYRDSNIPFPISLIIPNGMGTLTTVFGFGLPLLVMILIYKGLWRNPFVILGIMNAIFGVLLGQANSRFFLESFYWIIIGVLVSGVLLPVQNFWLIISKGLIVLQSIFIFVAMSFGILTISVGSLSEDKRIKVMETSASYYKFMAWVNYILPFNALVLS